MQPARKRRWFSFSLRTTALLLTILLILLGVFANRALRQQKAVATILAKGGRVFHEYDNPLESPLPLAPHWSAKYIGLDFVETVTGVDLIGQEFTDDDLALLDDLPRLRWLYLYDTKMTGAGFQHVSQLRHVENLVVNLTPLTDEAMPEVAKMKQLTDLHITGAKITDLGARAVAQLPNLETLSLSDCPVTDAGFSSPLPDSLREVSLEDTALTDAGLRQLGSLPNLTRLSLYGTKVTDQCVPYLTSLPNLRAIMLGNTAVSDTGLRKLKALGGRALVVSPDPEVFD